MTCVQEWVEDLRRDIPEPLDPVIARQVRYAIQEFFRESEAWRVKQTITVVEGQNVYPTKGIPLDTYGNSLDWGYFTPEAGVRFRLTNEIEQNVDLANTRDQYRTETISLSDDGKNFILNSNKESGILTTSIIIQPNREIDEVDDVIAQKWFDSIRKGALAKLLMMPNRDWTNIKASGRYYAGYADDIKKAKREAKKHRSRPRRVTKFNPGFAW